MTVKGGVGGIFDALLIELPIQQYTQSKPRSEAVCVHVIDIRLVRLERRREMAGKGIGSE